MESVGEVADSDRVFGGALDVERTAPGELVRRVTCDFQLAGVAALRDDQVGVFGLRLPRCFEPSGEGLECLVRCALVIDRARERNDRWDRGSDGVYRWWGACAVGDCANESCVIGRIVR